jgi:hypothetical protein
MLLGAHPQMCTIGEVKAPAIGQVPRYRCSCGQDLTVCGFWRALTDEVASLGSQLVIGTSATDIRKPRQRHLRALLAPLHRGPVLETVRDIALALSPGWRQHERRVQCLTTAVARAACTISGKEVFVDSSKTGVQLKYLLRNPDVDVKVIRLVRDGRGVSLSYRKAEGFSMSAAAYEWRRSNEEAEVIWSRLPADRTLDLRYEALCREPEATLREVFSFVGVGPVTSLPQLASVRQHVLGNDKMRLNPRAIRLDEAWRSALGTDDLRIFERVAGRLNRRLGYHEMTARS